MTTHYVSPPIMGDDAVYIKMTAIIANAAKDTLTILCSAQKILLLWLNKWTNLKFFIDNKYAIGSHISDYETICRTLSDYINFYDKDV